MMNLLYIPKFISMLKTSEVYDKCEVISEKLKSSYVLSGKSLCLYNLLLNWLEIEANRRKESEMVDLKCLTRGFYSC